MKIPVGQQSYKEPCLHTVGALLSAFYFHIEVACNTRSETGSLFYLLMALYRVSCQPHRDKKIS